jgi:SAM-dependent methyltransferase
MTYDAFNEYERTMWEQRAAGYADSFETLTALTIEPLLDAVGATRGTDLLDVGTGPGFVAAAAVARGAHVVGVDVADSMIELALRRVPEGRFGRGSAEKLPEPDASFDAVVGNFVMLHLGYPDRAAAEARRVLRVGGRCAFTVWEPADTNRAIGVFHEAIARAGVTPAQAAGPVPEGPLFFALADGDAFTALLTNAGFVDVRVMPCRSTLRVAPGAWWESTLRSTPRTGALIERQPAAVRARIRSEYDELVAAYADGAEVQLPVAAVLASAVAPTA